MYYPISPSLKNALEQLYDDPSMPDGFLAQGLPLSQRNSTVPKEFDCTQRVQMLCQRMEEHIELLAEQIEELGEGELPRLRAEATATLIALREIQTHFPYIVGQES